MNAIKLGTKELRSIEFLLSKEVKSPIESWVIIEKVFSGKPCTCFCKMNGDKNLEIKSQLYYFGYFGFKFNYFENEDGSILMVPRGAGEKKILSEDLDNTERVLLAAPDNGEGKFRLVCFSGINEKVELDPNLLEIQFILPSILEDYVKIFRKPRGLRSTVCGNRR